MLQHKTRDEATPATLRKDANCDVEDLRLKLAESGEDSH